MSHRLFAHLAHVEVLTPHPDESLRFYTDVLGLVETEREGQSVYLRGWGEWNHHSLKLTESAQPGLAHLGWRAWSAEHLQTAVSRLEDRSAPGEWQEAETGHGPSYRFTGPGGHVHEVFWETQRYKPPADMVSPYPNRPQRYVPRGIAPRQLDHVTVMTADPVGDAEWYRDVLGFTFTEYTVLDNTDLAVFAMVTNNEKSHDLGLLLDQSGTAGRLHHVAWWVDTRDEVLRAADIFLNADVPIEYGPGRHGMGEQDYLYVQDPSGNRVEINTGGYRLYEPDWETRRWSPSQGSNTFYKNVPGPDSMMEGTPRAAVKELIHEDAANPWAVEGVH